MWTQCFLGLGILGIAAPVASENVERHFEETFSVAEGVTLLLESGDGNVKIAAWDQDVIEVVVDYRADERKWGFGSNRELRVEFEQRGDVVHVKEAGHGGAHIGIRIRQNSQYTYVIHAPAYTRLDIRGEDGDVEVVGWVGDIKCRLDDGDLHLTDVQSSEVIIRAEDGDVRLRNVRSDVSIELDDGDILIRDCALTRAELKLNDGDVQVRQSSGDFDIDIDDGDVDLDEVAARRLRIRANDGQMTLHALEVKGMDWDIKTDDGDVVVTLAPGLSTLFSVETDDGRIDLDLAFSSDIRRERHYVAGRLNSGNGDLRVRTQDGGVRLRQN